MTKRVRSHPTPCRRQSASMFDTPRPAMRRLDTIAASPFSIPPADARIAWVTIRRTIFIVLPSPHLRMFATLLSPPCIAPGDDANADTLPGVHQEISRLYPLAITQPGRPVTPSNPARVVKYHLSKRLPRANKGSYGAAKDVIHA